MKKIILFLVILIILPKIANAIEIKPSLIPQIQFVNENNEKIFVKHENPKIEIFTIKNEEPKNHEIEKNFWNDENILRFVNPDFSLTKIDYEPKDLVEIKSKYISGNEKLRLEAKNKLDEMGKNFYEKFGIKINVVSGYRSYKQQVFINNSKKECVKNGFCAKPGFSEHQLGLAIDIFGLSQEIFEKNKKYKNYYNWMLKNAHKYGWTQSYQK